MPCPIRPHVASSRRLDMRRTAASLTGSANISPTNRRGGPGIVLRGCSAHGYAVEVGGQHDLATEVRCRLSSPLVLGAGSDRRDAVGQPEGAYAGSLGGVGGLLDGRVVVPDVDKARHCDLVDQVVAAQIGRASRRERVCPYV